MASINFPIVNNKEIEYPLKPDMKTVFPTYYSGDSLNVGGYYLSGSSIVKASDGWTSDIKTDAIWIGKNIEPFTFRFDLTHEYVKHEIASISFEDGRTDMSNLFGSLFYIEEIDGSDTVVEDGTIDFSEIPGFPFFINTSVRLPSTMNNFPGITLEAPYTTSPGDKWECNVVLSNPNFNGFTIRGGNFGDLGGASSVIQINDGGLASEGADKIANLNSEDGTVNIYFPNITMQTLRNQNKYPWAIVSNINKSNVHCNLRLFFNSDVFEGIKDNEYWTDSQANEYGYFELKSKRMTGLEAKVKDVISDSKEDIPEVTLADIDEMVDAPLISILEISGESRTSSGVTELIKVQGVFSFNEQDSDDTKYISFIYNLGSMTAYLMDENRNPDSQTDTDVSSEVTIDPLYLEYGTEYVPVVSFRGGIDSKLCPVVEVK